jgi:hypothetical protein
VDRSSTAQPSGAPSPSVGTSPGTVAATSPATPVSPAALPFTVLASWPVPGRTLALISRGGSVYRLSQDFADTGFSQPATLTRLDAVTGKDLAHRQFTGVHGASALVSGVWVAADLGPDQPSRLYQLDPGDLSTVLVIEVPHTGELPADQAEGLDGQPVAAGGWIWVSFGRHFRAYSPTNGHLQVDLTEPAGLQAGALGASSDGTRLWTAAWDPANPVAPVQERDATTGAVLASGTTRATAFVAAGPVMWTALHGGMMQELARIRADGTTIPDAVPAGDDTFLPQLGFRVVNTILWVTGVYTLECADPQTGHVRQRLTVTSPGYNFPTQLPAGHMLIEQTTAGENTKLLTVTPNANCVG